MTTHDCPFDCGQLMALHAIVKVAGHETLAAVLLDHSKEHPPEPSGHPAKEES